MIKRFLHYVKHGSLLIDGSCIHCSWKTEHITHRIWLEVDITDGVLEKVNVAKSEIIRRYFDLARASSEESK